MQVRIEWTYPHDIEALTGGARGDATPSDRSDASLRRDAQ
jgi:hypothetical protein